MSIPQNPLLVLGVPKWVIEREKGNLERLRKIAQRCYRALSHSYHTDQNTQTEDVQQALTYAWEDISTDDGLQLAITWLFGGSEAQALAVKHFAQRERNRVEEQLRAAANMLPFVDARHVLGRAPVELLLSEHLHNLAYDNYILAHTGEPYAGIAAIYMPGGLCTAESVRWDAAAGRWQGERFADPTPEQIWEDAQREESQLMPGPAETAYFTLPKSPEPITVAGVVTDEAFYSVYNQQQPDAEPIGKVLAAAERRVRRFGESNPQYSLDWLTIDAAWWLKFLQPQYDPNVPSRLVGARASASGVRVTLLGRVLGSRPLV